MERKSPIAKKYFQSLKSTLSGLANLKKTEGEIPCRRLNTIAE
ncbi:MAG: hypothetical protein SWO11_09550 [Thermodesulfobacteriota bacterium]|nr:hypothetical protein [Thermodesulfobacteriota bacterium]